VPARASVAGRCFRAAYSRFAWPARCLLQKSEGWPTMRTALVCAVIVLTVLPVDGGEPLKLAVTPAQSFAPGFVRIRARIEPNAENRLLTIVADGADFYRSSEIQLDGDQAPRTVEVRFADLPGGEYEVYAALTDASGRQRAAARQPAKVISMLGDH
jgi:hypothetical protein